MITIEQALEIVDKENHISPSIFRPLAESLDYTLATAVFSRIDMPPFRQSAMDGYAVNLNQESNIYIVKGEIKAGDSPNYNLKIGEAVRIFTGAAVPNTANAVIMQEKVRIDSTNNTIILEEEYVKEQNNIRSKGEQIEKGSKALKKGAVLTPAALSFLASLGIHEVEVYPKPKVTLVVTGSELIPLGADYLYGKIYESNSILLNNLLKKEGISSVNIVRVNDDFESTKEALKEAITTNDFVLVSGGISVGDYDFVGKALLDLGTQSLFYKIKQKPGKPLFFGKNNSTYIFALPGNPASALTCFYIYALPMLRKFSGIADPHLLSVQKTLSHNYKVKGIRAQFLKAIVENNEVSILHEQNSAMIQGFITANAFVQIPENSIELKKGDKVKVLLLP